MLQLAPARPRGPSRRLRRLVGRLDETGWRLRAGCGREWKPAAEEPRGAAVRAWSSPPGRPRPESPVKARPQQPAPKARSFFSAPSSASTLWSRLVALCPLLSLSPKKEPPRWPELCRTRFRGRAGSAPDRSIQSKAPPEERLSRAPSSSDAVFREKVIPASRRGLFFQVWHIEFPY